MTKEGVLSFKLIMAERSEAILRNSKFLVRNSAVPMDL